MNTSTLVDDYRYYLETHTNRDRAEKEKAYLYSDFTHYGLAFGLRGKFLQSHKKFLLQLPKSEVLKLMDKLWQQPSFEEKMLGLDILVLHTDSLDASDVPLIERLMRTAKGWALLDNFVIQIMPVILTKDPQSYTYLKDWISDDDYWVRRSALLAQLLFFRRGKGGDKALFFKMAQAQFDETWIDRLYQDPMERKRAKFFIRKAIGWTLRDMSSKDPERVFEFLKKYGPRMSGLTFREGSRKLPEALKIRLKQSI